MELHILGATKTDKGNQLERLTKHLLEEEGYTDIFVNERGSGGQEIDVRAEIKIPILGVEQSHRVICECKAHKTAIDITDWLKFLGKIFVEESRLKQQINGCFIALSGVNGAVSGNYDILKQERQGIEIITGEGLIRLLMKTFNIIPPGEVTFRVRNLTLRQFTRISLCYYEQKIYWLIEFDGQKYSLLSGEGIILEADDSSAVQSLLVSSEMAVGEFIDLQAEAEALRRAKGAEKVVLTALMLLGGEGMLNQVLKIWQDSCTDDYWSSFSADELDVASRCLAEKQLLDIVEDSKVWTLLPDQLHNKIERIVEIYKCLLHDEILIAALGCSFYDEHINIALLDKICEIQGGIELSEKQQEECLKLLRWSPEALIWAFHPDPMLVQNEQGISINERIKKFHMNYFLEQLFVRFNLDFDKGPLGRYFYSIRNLREVDTKRNIEVKGVEESELVLELRTRLSIGEADEALGGGIAKVRLFEDVSEPWENTV